MKQFSILVFFALVLAAYSSVAQNASIRGFVYEKETGEPVIFTNVYLLNTSYGASTDVNGYYSITQIPPGNYQLTVTALGYDSIKMTVTLKKGDVLTRQLFLNKASYTLETVNVSATREEARTETRTSVAKITPKEMKQIPTIGGQADLAQYLQVLPGVIFTGDQGGQLYIRGGSPIQNKVLLDGMVVYNPFHSIGLFSVFDTDLMRNADVYTGGFNSDFGGRISSVMDITTRDGNKKRLAGKIEANTFGSKVLIEGPLKRQPDEGGSSSSFVLSVKNSYLEQSSKALYSYVNEDGLPFNFLDLYGKVSFNGQNGSKFNLFGFNYTDRVNNYQSLSNFSWDAVGGGSNFVVIPGKSPVLLEGNIAFSSYKATLAEADAKERTSKISGFNAGLQFTYFLGKDELKYGVELLGFKTNYRFFNSYGIKIEQEENTTELAGYLKYKLTAGPVLIEPGLRLQWYASLSEVSLEPRIAMKYNLSDRIRMKAAAGLYSQNLISANSDRDVVNLFYGFLSGPESLPDEFDGKEVTSKLQKAQHLVGGIEFDLTNDIVLNVEGYYKNFNQLTNLNRYKIFDDSEINATRPDELKKDFVVETGKAYGMDLSLKYEFNRWYFWGAYSLSWVDRFDGNQTYYPHYDRRHNVNLVSSVKLGPAQDWEISARWNYGSGFPFTLNQGMFENITFVGLTEFDPSLINGSMGIVYGDLNTGRLSDYHRLDLNVKKKFEISNHSELELNAGVTNLYDRKNVFYRNRITGEVVNQLPVMWMFGASITF
ncbi:MAG: TonB-dependent receptor [Bacteroidales bacterium]|nr:TonB-dependent receptor [Bacteroidales bacterium]MDD3663635.1 TonB-dependent receptor [Bacteroidales bacterium]